MLELSLRTRLILTAGLLLGATAVAPLLVLPGRLEARAEGELERRAASVARAFGAASEVALDFDDGRRADEVLRELAEVEDAAYGVLRRGDGSTLAAWGEPPAPMPDPGPEGLRTLGHQLHARVPLETPAGERGSLQVGLRLDSLEQRRRESWATAGATAGVVFLLGLGVAAMLFSSLAKPLRQVAALATRIGRGDEAAARDLDLSRDDEAGALAGALARTVEQLVAQRTTLQSQSEASSEGILTLGLRGEVLASNRRLKELWDLPAEALEGACWADVRARLDRALASPLPAWLQAPAPGTPDGAGVDVDVSLADGRRLTLHAAPIRSGADEALGLCLFFRDVTALHRAQERARGLTLELEARVAARTSELAEANRLLAARLEDLRNTQEQLVMADRAISVGRLAAGVAHEVNNPLASITANMGFVSEEVRALTGALAAAGGADARGWAARLGEVAAAVEDTSGSAQRVARIVRDLKTAARPAAEVTGPVRLQAAMEAALGMATVELKHRARVERQYGPAPTVDGDEGRLSQVFLNLLLNAGHAIPAGQADRNLVTVAVGTTPDGWALAEVRDTGCGIPPDLAGRVFDPFFTTRPQGQGTGLGLSVSKGIVDGLGGRIELESAPGRGTTFRVLLPPGREVTAPTPPPAPPPAVARASIMVIDDEPAIGAAVSRLLGREHDVTAEVDPRAALRRLARGERFDLVLCDLMMPSMTGMAFFQALRDLDPDEAERVVFITGGSLTSEVAEFTARHADRCLHKPLDTAELRRQIHARSSR